MHETDMCETVAVDRIRTVAFSRVRPFSERLNAAHAALEVRQTLVRQTLHSKFGKRRSRETPLQFQGHAKAQ